LGKLSKAYEKWHLIIEAQQTEVATSPFRKGEVRMTAEKMKFHNLGIPVRADEERSSAVCINEAGDARVVIAARGYVLIVHPDTGECRQVPFPEGVVDYPFASMSSSKGIFYTGASRLFMALDPFAGCFIHYGIPAPEEEIVGFAFAEDDNGRIYTTTYPKCWLVRYDPVSGKTQRLIQLDPHQKYAASLAMDAGGWIYAGIGTECRNIAAYHPEIGALQPLVPEGERTRGSGVVLQGRDGAVYGHYGSSEAEEGLTGWYRLEGGRKAAVDESELGQPMYRGNGYKKIHRDFQDGRHLRSVSLSDRELTIADALSGKERMVPLDYEANGTQLSPLALGPDGSIYGTSNHPMHFYAYLPDEDRFIHYGGKAIELGGGGNICANAVQGGLLAGAAYAGGHLHLFDPKKPVCYEAGAERNPRLVFSSEHIHRPRCAIAHPDGEHVVYGGFAGYGAAGGAIGIYNIRTGQHQVIPNDAVVPFQSTLCLAVTEEGDLIGGTSIETPGGAHPRAAEAQLYVMDWRTKTVLHRWVPIPGSREISLMLRSSQSHIHVLTSECLYAVIDYRTHEMLHSQDLSMYGGIVRNGLEFGNDGCIYALLSRGIFRVNPNAIRIEIIAVPPEEITAGMALHENCLYFASGSKLWRYSLQ
jgi:hypothetical protein